MGPSMLFLMSKRPTSKQVPDGIAETFNRLCRLGGMTQPDESRAWRKAALLVNTKSRNGAALFADAKAALTEAGVPLAIAIAERKPDRIADHARAAREAGCDLIIVGGGDGTISGTVGAVAGADCAFAPLPLGTANSFSRSLGLDADLEAAIAAIVGGKVAAIDLADLDGHLFANSASIGLSPIIGDTIPQGFKSYLGRLGYLAWALYTMARFRPFRFEIDADGRALKGWATEVRMLNGQFVGGVNFTDTARLDDGKLLVQIVTGKSRLKLAYHWYRRLLRLTRAPHETTDLFAGEFKIATFPPRRISIDGEVIARTPAILKVRRSAFKCVVPATFARRGSGNSSALSSVETSASSRPGSEPRRKIMTDTIHGEGNYEAAREFQKEQHDFAKSGKVEAAARDAANALDGPEADEIEAARKAAAESHSA